MSDVPEGFQVAWDGQATPISECPGELSYLTLQG